MKAWIGFILFLILVSGQAMANTWQGTIDRDWYNAGNWSDETVPGAGTDVTIPDVANDPLIANGSGAECNDLNTASGSLLEIGDTLTVHGDMNINGEIYIPSSDSLYVYGDVDWRAGSTAYIGGWSNFFVYGDWQFYSGSDVQLTNGVVRFAGDNSSVIISHEEDNHFYDLRIEKTGEATVSIAEWSTEALHIQHDLQIMDEAFFYSNAPVSIFVNGDFSNFIGGQFDFDNGTIVMTGASPDINCNDGRFYNLTIQCTGTAELTSDLKMDGNLVMTSGSLDSNYYDIEIKGDWTDNSTGVFVPHTGKVTFRGSNSTITTTEYWEFYDLAVSGYISPPTSAAATIAEDNAVYVKNNLDINYPSTLTVSEGAQLRVGNEINVYFSCSLNAVGVSGNHAIVGGWGDYRPRVQINSGGHIGGEYAIFQYLDEDGINIKSGGLISTTYPFSHCMFQYGASGGTLLTIDNNQAITLDYVQFPENTWNGKYNVMKTSDQGQIWFTNYSGDFSGPKYEKDPHHLILWGDGPHDANRIESWLNLLLLAE